MDIDKIETLLCMHAERVEKYIKYILFSKNMEIIQIFIDWRMVSFGFALHTIEYCIAVKIEQLKLYVSMWMNLRNTI